MKRIPRKPTGTIGVLRLGQDGAAFIPVPWPSAKDEIERHVLTLALKSAKDAGLGLYELTQDPVQNEEQHFDFSLQTKSGTQYLDLMEIAPLGTARGHANAPGSYIVGEMATAIWDALQRKSEGYGPTPNPPVHLMLYPTDWHFQVGGDVTDLLGYWSLQRTHCFTSIVYFAPDDPSTGEVVHIYPRSKDSFVHFNEQAAQRGRVALANLTRPKPSEGSA